MLHQASYERFTSLSDHFGIAASLVDEFGDLFAGVRISQNVVRQDAVQPRQDFNFRPNSHHGDTFGREAALIVAITRKSRFLAS